MSDPHAPSSAAGALSEAEVDALLARPILARLATIDQEGAPSIVPVWTEWDAGALWVVARAGAGFVGHIRREPRVGVSIVDDVDPDRRIQMAGRATIVAGPGPLDGRMLEAARRMGRRYEGEPGIAYVEATRSWPRCLIRIDPLRIRSWGSPEWHPRYRPGGADGGR